VDQRPTAAVGPPVGVELGGEPADGPAVDLDRTLRPFWCAGWADVRRRRWLRERPRGRATLARVDGWQAAAPATWTSATCSTCVDEAAVGSRRVRARVIPRYRCSLGASNSSPSATAGAGDSPPSSCRLILQTGGRPGCLSDRAASPVRLPAYRPGDRLAYQVVRGGRTQEVTVTLRPAEVAGPLLRVCATILLWSRSSAWWPTCTPGGRAQPPRRCSCWAAGC
jgi:hypothetical protein